MQFFKILIVIFVCSSTFLKSQGLMVNEFSNGSGGFQEYIELLVVPNPNNPCACVDIGGWIIDDNNGDFEGTGAGVGIANGHLRFKSGCLPCLSPGTIILVYNADDRFAGIPADDLTDTNNDKVYILPHTASCLEVCTSAPTTSNINYSGCSYVTTTLTGTTSWAVMGLANTGDACQVRDPNGLFFHGFSYGNVGTPFPNLNAQFGGLPSFNIATGSGSNFTYIYDCGAMIAANWSRIAATSGTPGAPNTANNQNFINNLTLASIQWSDLSNAINCSVSNPIIFAGNDTSICSGNSLNLHATINISTNVSWSTNGDGLFSVSNQLISTYTPGTNDLINGTVKLYIQSTCPALIDSLTLTILNNTTPTFTQVAAICAGGTFTLPTTSNNSITGTWSPAINNSSTTTYTFTPTAGQCANTTTMTVTVNQPNVPTFTQVASICSGGTFTLPTTSNNSITGTWSPAVNNSSTTTYTFTPTAGQCATTTTMTVTVNQPIVPTFTQVASICSGGTFTLPTTSNNSISGIWSPAVNNTTTTTYTFTPTAGQCATATTMTVAVNNNTTPTFTQVPTICSGGTFTLPTTSNNSITGTWSPAINNTTTTTYTFTPTAGQCATTTTMTVTVNPNVTPTFTQVSAICSGGTFTLPTTSNNSITGTWSPAINNSSTTTYTFTPTAGQCATTTTMTVTVNPNVTPTFTQVAAICSGGTFTLPTTSNNAITGTWSPAINNSITTTYTFTPTAGQCATTTTMTVTVNPIVTPTFTQVAAICSGGTFTLPTASNNSITGTWSPAINNSTTTTYTFTPTAGQCATTTTMTVTVNQPIVPNFTQVAAICSGGSFSLPTTSSNSITGTWSPAINNSSTTTYTFTPTAGQCATTQTMTVTVNPIPSAPTASNTNACPSSPVHLSASGSGTLLWYNQASGGSILASGTNFTTLVAQNSTFYVESVENSCTSSRTAIQVTINGKVFAGNDTTICSGQCVNVTASGSDYYSWIGETDSSQASQTFCPTSTTNFVVKGYSEIMNLVPNGDFESGNTGFTSSYIFTSNTFPEGTYYIANNASIPHSGFAGFDHTTGSTNLMIINGSGTPGTNVWCQTIPVNPNTDYVFSTWVSSLVAGSPALLQFNINGVQLGNVFSAPASTFNWQQFYITWNSGASNTANICIVNQNTATGGNDFGLDDIYFSELCTTYDTLTVTIANPAQATINDTTICSGNSVTLNILAPLTGQFDWYDSITGGNLLQANNQSFTTPNLTANSSYFIETIENGCTSARKQVNVTVNPIPAQASINDTSICSGNSLTLNILAPLTGQFDWYDSITGGNLLQANNQSFTTPNLTTNTSYFIETIENGCTSARKQVNVTVNPIPAQATINDTSICSGNSLTLNILAPLAGQFDWYDASSGGNLLQANNQSFTTPNLTTNTSYFIETIENGCTSARKQVNVTVNPIPALATINDTTICSGNSVTLNILAPLAGQFDWYDASSGGNLLQANNQTFTTSILTTNTSYFIETIENGCTSARKQVNVTVNPIPDLATINDTSICSGNSVTLNILAPITGQFDWYNASSGGNLLQANNQTFTTPILTANTSYFIETIENGCTSARKQVNVTVNPIPALATINDTTICSGTSVVLTVLAPTTGQLDWYTAPNAGTLLQANSQTFTTPILTTNTSYFIETVENGCTMGRKEVQVLMHQQPTADFPVFPSPVCQGTQIPITGTPNAVVNYTENGVNQNLTLDASGNGFLTANSTGNTLIQWQLVSVTDANCTANLQDSLSVSLVLLDANFQLLNDTICQGDQAILQITGSPNADVYFSFNGTSDTITLDNNGLNQIILTDSNTVIIVLEKVEVMGIMGICTRNLQKSDTLVVNPLPNAPIFVMNPICTGQTANISVSNAGNNQVFWYQNATDTIPFFIGNPFISSVLTDSTIFYAELIQNGCTGPRTNINQIVLPIGTANFNLSTQTGFVPFAVNITDSSIQASEYQWIILGDTIRTAFVGSVNFETAGTYPVTLIINESGCSDTLTKTIIAIEPDDYIYIPNVFTPNSDGVNDYYSVSSNGIKSFSIEIFDRWGTAVYSNGSINFQWNGTKNGKECPEGVYVYVIKAETITGKNIHRAGSISLLR